MRGDDIRPVKACCSTEGEYQDRKVRVGGWVSRGLGDEIGGFQKRNEERE